MKKFFFLSVLVLLIAIGTKSYSQTGSQSFTTSGVFTVPADVTVLTIELVGAGGSGGGNGGGGGGGGGYASGVYYVVPLADYIVTVGTAGGGASGGTTSVGTLISATGGENGTWVPNPNLGGGGTGGVGSNGTIANRIGGLGGGGFWTYFGGGGGGAAGSVSDGFAGGNTITWTGNCLTPGGAKGLGGGVPGGNGGKGAGFTDSNCNITDPAGNGENYGGGGGGGNGNGGGAGTGNGGYVLITWEISSSSNCCDYSNNGQNIGIEGESFGVALGDLDGDNDLDAVKVDAYNDIEIYENDGNASFTLMQNIGADEWRYGVKIVDVDMDGDLDIVTTGFGQNYGGEVYKNNGSGIFTLAQDNIASNLTIQKFDIADLNGDTFPDLFLPAYSGSGSQVLFNNGLGHFDYSPQTIPSQSCTDVALGDIDGDGDADAFISCTNSTPSMVWINNGSGIFSNSGQTLGTGNSYGVDMADLDNDGDLDVVCANWTVPSQVWLNDGDGNFTEGFVINNNNYAKSVKLVDHDYDHLVDIFIGSYGSHGLQIWHNIGSGNFDLCYENTGDVYAQDIAVGDLNNDLMPDVYLGNFSSGDGDQVFTKASTVIVNENTSLCLGDSIFLGGSWQYTAGNYIDALNCDTIIQTALEVIVVDTSVTVSFSTLTANADNASYQWLDCSTWLPVEGATDQSFTPTETGNYAVEVTQENCIDISGCYYILISGMNDLQAAQSLHVYPNPAGNKLFIEAECKSGLMKIKITDMMGLEFINQNSVPTRSLVLDVSDLKIGCYFLHIQYSGSSTTRKVLIYR